MRRTHVCSSIACRLLLILFAVVLLQGCMEKRVSVTEEPLTYIMKEGKDRQGNTVLRPVILRGKGALNIVETQRTKQLPVGEGGRVPPGGCASHYAAGESAEGAIIQDGPNAGSPAPPGSACSEGYLCNNRGTTCGLGGRHCFDYWWQSDGYCSFGCQ